ncbi:hypothetical protein ABZ354_24775 [Streptomyces sp. NPDC005925]|uniref:hypothetical protein n=1 Tax=Streptomyces sp. NPDC005925 TaxID=3157172 RepID=UPI0033D80E5B
MRNLIAALRARFPASRGTRPGGPHPVPTPPAAAIPSPAPRSSRRVTDAIPADAVPVVRPYVVHWERHCERRMQQERRVAAVLATFGADYPYGPQGCAA